MGGTCPRSPQDRPTNSAHPAPSTDSLQCMNQGVQVPIQTAQEALELRRETDRRGKEARGTNPAPEALPWVPPRIRGPFPFPASPGTCKGAWGTAGGLCVCRNPNLTPTLPIRGDAVVCLHPGSTRLWVHGHRGVSPSPLREGPLPSAEPGCRPARRMTLGAPGCRQSTGQRRL